MIKTAVCLVALALAAQVPTSSAMVGGNVVTDASTFSFQAAIRPIRVQGGVTINTNVCSGVVLQGEDNSVWILTTATCALEGTDYQVFVGSNRVPATAQPDITLPASSAIIHPEYLQSFSESDLALIPDDSTGVLAGLIGGTNATVRKVVTPALLLSADDATKSYLASSINMAGWGYPSDVFHGQATSLRQLSSRVVPNWYCNVVNFGKPITSRHMCTGGLINKGPCTGDSGAPLIFRDNGANRVIGLATLTPSNGCNKGKPGVFTRLGNYLPWIRDITTYNVEQ